MKDNFIIETQKRKLSEELFFDNFEKFLKGIKVKKIAPFDNLNFDLLYIEDKYAVILKFIDTTEEIFDILGEEIVEIIEEENKVLQEELLSKIGKSIDYYVFMPFVDFTDKNIECKNIIDKSKMLKMLDNKDISLILSEIDLPKEKIFYTLTRENYILNKEYKEKKIKLEDEKIKLLDTLCYGKTLIEGSSGTGKTTFMISAIYKLAKIYPNDKFLYVTFDKYLKQKIKKIFIDEKINNIKVVNFHQFIVMLGKKNNLRLNINSKTNFSVEFEKLFNKVRSIYKGKMFFKGIFVDEAENLNFKELKFLSDILYLTKNIFYISFDSRKKLVINTECGIENFNFDNKILFKKNFRNSSPIIKFNKKYQKLINKFSLLEVGEFKKYFLDFSNGSKKDGNVYLYKHNTDNIDDYISRAIEEYIAKGYDYSDICIIFPYNKNKTTEGLLNSREKIQNILKKSGIDYIVADDNLIINKKSVLISNIFNCINLNPKIVIFCCLETVYNLKTEDEIKRLLNIIYIATSRAERELHILLKEDEERPGSVDLLEQSIDSE